MMVAAGDKGSCINSSDRESLAALEALLQEFYAANTDNARKKEIEGILLHFSKQQMAWKHCLYYISNTRNEYVLMYCLNVLENVVNQQWMGVRQEDRIHIRQTAFQMLLVGQSQVSTFVRNKMIKLIVVIARLDWPQSYPEFFQDLISLLNRPETIVLGLVLLQMTSEELASPRDDISVARKEELQRFLAQQVPSILQILTNILEKIKGRSAAKPSTPPPSPTHGQPSSGNFLTSTPIKQGLLHKGMSEMSPSRERAPKMSRFDAGTQVVCTLSLQCLGHLFTWIQLSSTITSQLLVTIFHFASFGCDSTAGESQRHVGEKAMSCINELLTRNCVPPEFTEFLLTMFTETFKLLTALTKEDPNVSGNQLDLLSDSYLDKFTEFLQLFVSLHLRRFESNPQFPMLDFLALLFRFTFKQPSNEGFFNCLAVWSEFLDYLTSKLDERHTDKQAYLIKYQEALQSLASEILQKIQFRFNQSQLELLDDDILDDDFKTEWQYFLAECLEIIAKVTQLYPNETFGRLFGPFQESMTVYYGLEHFITGYPLKRQLNVTAENDCRRLHCSLRDLSSMLQAYGRLADHFVGEKFVENFDNGYVLMDRLIQTGAYGTKLKLYEVGSSIESVLAGDFIDVHAQSMAAVKAYCPWLSRFYVESRKDESSRSRCDAMIGALLESVIPLFLQETVPEKVLLSASHLLLSLCTSVRPAFLYNIPIVRQLYSSGIIVSSCPPEVELLTYRALSHYLLLPWPAMSDTDQNWDVRVQHLTSLLGCLMHGYVAVRDVAGLKDDRATQESAKPCIERSLSILTDVIGNLEKEGISRSKQLCYTAVSDYIQVTFHLLPIFISQSAVADQMLGFFLSVFQSLRVQLGVQLTEKLIQTLMSLFTRELVLQSLHEDRASGHQLIDKFLRILQVIAKEPGASFKAFLPSILSLCLEQVYPVLAERSSPDVKPTLFELLYELFRNNWKFFFKSNVLNSIGKEPSEQVEHRDQFISIMQAFGQSFLQPDIALFRQNLECLEALNEQYKLYHKMIFREMLLSQFISVLLHVLIQRTHNLLRDEIGNALYNMAAVDFDGFYSQFLPNFLNVTENVDDCQKLLLLQIFRSEKDLPSFTQNIYHFVNDLRFYRLVNCSLPEGSVTL